MLVATATLAVAILNIDYGLKLTQIFKIRVNWPPQKKGLAICDKLWSFGSFDSYA